jgi:hypothetical protein
MNLRKCFALSMLALGLSVVSVTSPNVGAQGAQQDAENVYQATEDQVMPASGFFVWSGNLVKGLRARTNTAPSQIGSSGDWVTIPNAIIPITIPAGTADTLDVSFSAECTKVLGGRARIRVIDTVSGVTSSLEPNDGDVTFCSSASAATYTAGWLTRARGGTHNLQVQIMNTTGLVVIDDWKFRIVAYD